MNPVNRQLNKLWEDLLYKAPELHKAAIEQHMRELVENFADEIRYAVTNAESEKAMYFDVTEILNEWVDDE